MDRELSMQELQEQEKARIEQGKKEALGYVKENIFSATPGERCGDDRSMEEGPLAIFGASTGWVAALMAEGVAPERGRQIIKDINRAEGAAAYYFHDDVAGHSCGHEGLLSGEHAEEYGVTQEGMDVVKRQNAEDLKNGQAHKITYEGSHQAVRVLRVRGKDFTVRSNDQKEKNFVVDIDRIEEKVHQIAERAGADEQKLFDRVIAHTNITAAYLAEGLDIYDVIIDEKGNATVEYGGKVPPPPQEPEDQAA